MTSMVDAVSCCPDCLTVLPASVESCPACGNSVPWTSRHADFADQLRKNASRNWFLELDIVWPGGHSAVRETGPVNCQVLLPGQPGAAVRVESFTGSLELVSGGNRRVVALPAEFEWQGFHVRARLVAAPDPRAFRAEIRLFRPGEINLLVRSGLLTLGRQITSQNGTHINVPDDPSVELQHCAFVSREAEGAFYLADWGTNSGTFVNRRAILVQRLCSGDLIQLGGYAWIYNETDRVLVPVRNIHGIGLQIGSLSAWCRSGLRSTTLLRNVTCDIPAGEFVAICGPSGAGKSMLLKSLVGAVKSEGTILAAGRDIRSARDWYRNLLGYVSQERFLPDSLSTEEIVEFGSRFRLGEATAVSDLLRLVDLPQSSWSRPVRDLSGGQERRVRMAAELCGNVRLLLLDEPTSGLDPDLEIRMLTLLRSLSLRGCTVLVVVHNLHRLELFDRVLVVVNQSLRFAGSPQELKTAAGVTDLSNFDLNLTPLSVPVAGVLVGESVNDAGFRASWGHRLRTLLARESRRLWNSPVQRLLLPAILIPGLFAAALATMPGDQLQLLGFFLVLSSMWLAASVGAQEVVNDREVFEHERHLFIDPCGFVISKAVCVLGIACLQAVTLYGLLALFRWDWEVLYHPPRPVFVLMLVSCAGGALGLLISATVGRNRQAVGTVLALVMMLQIVFSLYAAGKGDTTRFKEYPAGWRFAGIGAESPSNEAQDSSRRGNIPLARYTIAAWGDVLLRSFAYGERDWETESPTVRNGWVLEAVVVLLVWMSGSCFVTWAILSGNGSWRVIHSQLPKFKLFRKQKSRITVTSPRPVSDT